MSFFEICRLEGLGAQRGPWYGFLGWYRCNLGDFNFFGFFWPRTGVLDSKLQTNISRKVLFLVKIWAQNSSKKADFQGKQFLLWKLPCELLVISQMFWIHHCKKNSCKKCFFEIPKRFWFSRPRHFRKWSNLVHFVQYLQKLPTPKHENRFFENFEGSDKFSENIFF